MSIAIAGIWELGWNIPLCESWMWTFPLREFGVVDWAMCPVTGIRHNEQHSSMVLTEFELVDDMVEKFGAGRDRVFIDEKGDVALQDFQHPEDAVYFFGCAGRSLLPHKREGDVSVRIDTIANNGVMWPHQCLAIVLHDRLVKSWQSP